jgi:hypothetical protein
LSEFFDDFSYLDVRDTMLSAHGWTPVHGVNAPPSGANYSRDLVSFEFAQPGSVNRLMVLAARTGGNPFNMVLSRMETPAVFREGTYAAQVFFDHALRKTQDGNIQTFYLISPQDLSPDSLYSECDIEYLPYDVWSDESRKDSRVYFATWESFHSNPFVPDHALSSLPVNLWGWHILIIRIMDGNVTYYLDKAEEPSASHRYSPAGSTVYPESLMHLVFANWITSTSEEFSGWRESIMKVDWVYFAADTTVDFFEIRRRVNAFRKAGTVFVNDLF